MELQPSSLALQTTLEDVVQVTGLVTRTELALLLLALTAEEDAGPVVAHVEQPPRLQDK